LDTSSWFARPKRNAADVNQLKQIREKPSICKFDFFAFLNDFRPKIKI